MLTSRFLEEEGPPAGSLREGLCAEGAWVLGCSMWGGISNCLLELVRGGRGHHGSLPQTHLCYKCWCMFLNRCFFICYLHLVPFLFLLNFPSQPWPYSLEQIPHLPGVTLSRGRIGPPGFAEDTRLLSGSLSGMSHR